MGQRYAGILGSLAFVAVAFRGLLAGGSVNSTLIAASLSLLAFSAIGYLAGQLGDWILTDAANSIFAAELEKLDRD